MPLEVAQNEDVYEGFGHFWRNSDFLLTIRWSKPVQGYMKVEAEAESGAEVLRRSQEGISFPNPYIGNQEGNPPRIPI